MKDIKKQIIPFISFVIISSALTLFYQSSNFLNEFGTITPEWMLLVDGLILLPIICFLCFKDKKEAIVQVATYSCLIIFIGSLIIPEHSKMVWHQFELLRYILISAFIIFEATTIFTVFLAIKASLANEQDLDKSISQPIENVVGKGIVSALLSFEARIWTYVLFSKKIAKKKFTGDKHFTYHKKDDTQSNQLGFILLILFEVPIMHFLLHLLWSSFSANIITGLSVLSLAFFISEYKATSIRPISITSKSVIVRYGIWNPLEILLADIEHIESNSRHIKRSKNIKIYNLFGTPNVQIKLKSGELIYLGVDCPEDLILTLEGLIATNQRMQIYPVMGLTITDK